jgi:hypothetical protein
MRSLPPAVLVLRQIGLCELARGWGVFGDPIATNPVDLIAARRWRSALITTYALGLSFFESFILRQLRFAHCREVTILVDPVGYRGCLLESGLASVGRSYRIVPVACRRGAFHLKLWYLQGEEEDCALIGSGNLTFGGCGHNFEVIDIFLSGLQPAVFGDIADALEAILTAPTVDAPRVQFLEKLAGRARSLARGGAAGSDVRLLCSLIRPIGHEIVQAAADLGGCQRLTILSPYFESLSGVEPLWRGLGQPEIDVALPGTPKQLSRFPFADAHRLGEMSVRPVRELKPLVVLVENIPDVLNAGGRNIAEEIALDLEELGFVSRYTLLNTVHYGIPQTRQRMFLIGLRREFDTTPAFPDPIRSYDVPRGYEQIRRAASRALRHDDLFRTLHWQEPPEVADGLRQAVTAKQAIGDLPPITSLRDGTLRAAPGGSTRHVAIAGEGPRPTRATCATGLGSRRPLTARAITSSAIFRATGRFSSACVRVTNILQRTTSPKRCSEKRSAPEARLANTCPKAARRGMISNGVLCRLTGSMAFPTSGGGLIPSDRHEP